MSKASTLGRVLDRCEVGDCWEWQGAKSRGYGNVNLYGEHWRVHRLVWTLLVGPICEGLVVDHLCKNKACCNPDHLEPVTQAENLRRSPNAKRNRSHCPYGHSYAGANLYVNPSGARLCRKCQRIRQKQYYDEKRKVT